MSDRPNRRAPLRRRLVPLLLLVMVGCGGGPPPADPPAATVDAGLAAERRLAQSAFRARSYEQAAVLYGRVLERAYARDDLVMIGDAGYELAIVELRRGRPRAAATLAARTRAELTRRGAAPFPELFLVEAFARWRLDELDSARRLLAETGAAAGRPAAALTSRIAYLQGLLAAAARDRAGLAAALAALDDSALPLVRADRDELAGRLALLDDDPTGALTAFERAIATRRAAGAFDTLPDSLALAGRAALAADQPRRAADLYLRAGRSAHEQGQIDDARRWLGEALRIARGTGQAMVRREAQDRLRALSAPSPS